MEAWISPSIKEIAMLLACRIESFTSRETEVSQPLDKTSGPPALRNQQVGKRLQNARYLLRGEMASTHPNPEAEKPRPHLTEVARRQDDLYESAASVTRRPDHRGFGMLI